MVAQGCHGVVEGEEHVAARRRQCRCRPGESCGSTDAPEQIDTLAGLGTHLVRDGGSIGIGGIDSRNAFGARACCHIGGIGIKGDGAVGRPVLGGAIAPEIGVDMHLAELIGDGAGIGYFAIGEPARGVAFGGRIGKHAETRRAEHTVVDAAFLSGTGLRAFHSRAEADGTACGGRRAVVRGAGSQQKYAECQALRAERVVYVLRFFHASFFHSMTTKWLSFRVRLMILFLPCSSDSSVLTVSLP